jgi:hypothetical protein
MEPSSLVEPFGLICARALFAGSRVSAPRRFRNVAKAAAAC